MSKAYAQGGRFFLESTDGTVKREIAVALDPGQGANLLEIRALDQHGVAVGDPVRLHLTDNGMIAADFPGVSDAYFTVDANGKITNG